MSGNNQLNGAQALAYVRARETLGDGSDLGRIKRQQMFLGDVLRQAMSGSMLTNPSRLTSFLDAATKAITVDKGTTFGDLRALARRCRASIRGVTFYTAPIAEPELHPAGHEDDRPRAARRRPPAGGSTTRSSTTTQPVWVTKVDGTLDGGALQHRRRRRRSSRQRRIATRGTPTPTTPATPQASINARCRRDLLALTDRSPSSGRPGACPAAARLPDRAAPP